MTKNRLEAFSDGVIAIIITIMVLEMRVPHGADVGSLLAVWPVFASYLASFTFLGIYWNNHHHMLHTLHHVSAGVMWANIHLLFWLSLVPFGTNWVGETHFAPLPMALYGVILLLCGVAYLLLQKAIIRVEGPGSVLARAVGGNWKGRLSAWGYMAAIPLAFVHPGISGAIYIAVALVWFIPDKRIERALRDEK